MEAGLIKAYSVSVNALAAPGSDSLRSYVLFSGHPEVDTASLAFAEVARYVDHTLATRGLTRAKSPAEASIALFVDYGVGAPQQVAYSYDVFGVTGGGISTVTVQTPSGETSTGQVSTPYQTGRVGTAVGTRTVYTRYLRMMALDVAQFRTEAKPVEAWTMLIVSSGSSGDIRELLPAMFVAAQPYVGQQTSSAVHLSIPTIDKRIAEMRTAAARP